MRTVIRNATVLDTATMTFDEHRAVVVEDGDIVSTTDAAPADATPTSMLAAPSSCPA